MMTNDGLDQAVSSGEQRPHPRTIGWVGTTALAMGGSNQSLFLIAGAGGLIATQGSAGVALLILGVLLAWAAAPGWTELILMYPNRVGGIASCCAEAFRPYSEVLANLTGVCYWWGWIPTCGLTALLSATALHQWYLPQVPVNALALAIICSFTLVTKRNTQRSAGCSANCRRFRHPGLYFGTGANINRACRLASGDFVSPGNPVRRLIRQDNLGHGWPLSGGLRCSGV